MQRDTVQRKECNLLLLVKGKMEAKLLHCWRVKDNLEGTLDETEYICIVFLRGIFYLSGYSLTGTLRFFFFFKAKFFLKQFNLYHLSLFVLVLCAVNV